MPSMYSVRVNYYLSQHYLKVGDSKNADRAAERMISTKHGLKAWKSTLSALEGTAYGSLLNYEIEKIERAISDTEEQQQKA